MYSTSKKHYRRKKRIMSRFYVVLTLIIILAVVSTLSWFVIHGIAQSVTTGDKPVSDTPANPAAVTTTETKPTYPTITIQGNIASPRVVLYDETHSSVLYSRGAFERCYPASLTKLMTAAIVSEYCTPDEVFTAGTELTLVDPESSLANLKAGYQLTRDMIIDALLLPSGNDAAYTIAAHVGRKVNNNPSLSDIDAIHAFIDLMNQTAKKIGAENTHFSNPDGIFVADHYTCANDMLLIAQNARKYDNLKTSMAKYTVHYTLLTGQNVSWENSNKIINPKSPYYFNGATGMKTGFTNEAGYCIVSSAQRNGVDMIAVVMGGPAPDSRWKDSDELFKEAFAAEVSHTTAASN